MNVTPKDAPKVLNPTNAASPAQSSKERAIAAFMNGQPPSNAQQTPVKNPSQVSPEEMSAITPSSSSSAEHEAQKIMGDSTVESVANILPEEPKESQNSTKEDPLSTQYALLAKKERALRVKEEQYKKLLADRENAFKAKEDALKAKEAEYQSKYVPKERIKQDILSVLNEAGVSYDEITQAILNSSTQQDPRILAEIERLKVEVQESRRIQEQQTKAYEDQQKQSYQQALNQIKMETKQLVQSNPDFETIRETGSVNDVVDLIEKTFQQDGILLTVDEAAREVEDYLVEQATRIARIKKVQSRLQQSNPQQQQAQAATQKPASEQKQTQPQMKTLTNSVTTTRKLTARERAIAAFSNALKK